MLADILGTVAIAAYPGFVWWLAWRADNLWNAIQILIGFYV